MNLFKSTAYICVKCLKRLDDAVEFRKLSRTSDFQFRKMIKEEEEICWNKKLIGLQCHSEEVVAMSPEIKLEEQNEVTIKSEPVDEILDCFLKEIENVEKSSEFLIEEDSIPPEIDLNVQRPKNIAVSKKTTRKKCPVCGKIVSCKYRYGYVRHLKFHIECREWSGIECSKCDKIFPTTAQLHKHCRKEHPHPVACDVRKNFLLTIFSYWKSFLVLWKTLPGQKEVTHALQIYPF